MNVLFKILFFILEYILGLIMLEPSNVASYIYIHVTFVSCSVLFTCIVITVAHFVVKLCCLLLDHV